jgi:hypothetical protein
MTVRTWVTLSVLILIALSVAIVARLLAPVPHPPILARSGDVRLQGQLIEACWPQRGGDLRCEKDGDDAQLSTIPGKGELRIVVAYPAQPDEGSIVIRRGETNFLREKGWDDEIAYALEPGRYELIARAEYPQDAFVSYRFPFRVR